MSPSANSAEPATSARTPEPGRTAPYLLLVGASVVMVAAAGLGPIRDIDSYWHVRLGREILDGASPVLAGRGWSFAPVPDTWVSTQWLAEMLFAWLDRVGGLDALIVYRAVTTMLVLLSLYLVTVHRRPVRAGSWLFLAGALAIGIYAQERPQQLTFILAPLIGWWIERAWRAGTLPRWWVVLPLVVVWANVHGGWVLLPLGLGSAALARWLDHGWRDRVALRALLLALVVTAGAALSPAGPSNIIASVRFRAATTLIDEWEQVVPWTWQALPLLPCLVLAIVCWARGRVRPTHGELVLVLAWFLFAMMAWRNLTPAILVLAPLLTGTLARALGLPDPRPTDERPPLARPALALAVAGAILSVGTAIVEQPVVPQDVPLGLLERVRDSAPQRLLNGYNVSGPVLYFAGPGVLVSIDGRADRHGNDYIQRDKDLTAGAPGWSDLVDELDPTSALLPTSSPLPELLVTSRGWVEVAREADWVLLHAPGATGWPST